MDQLEEDKKDVEYLKKRLQLAVRENDLLRKENSSQRKELHTLKLTFTNIVQDQRVKTAGPNGKSVNNPIVEYVQLQESSRFQNEQALRQILEMQRKRLDEVEKEHESIKNKYEKVLFSQKQDQPKVSYSQSLANQYADDSVELHEQKQRNRELEVRLKEVVTQHAKDIANFKHKIAQQDAEIILNKSLDHSFAKSFDQSLNRSSANNSREQFDASQKHLEPLNAGGNQFRILKQFSLNKKSLS